MKLSCSIARAALAALSCTLVSGAEPAGRPAASGESFTTASELQRYFDEQINECRRQAEARRLAALERLFATGKAPETQPALVAMIETALFLDRYQQAARLAEQFIRDYPESPEVWSARRVRFMGLIESGLVEEARKEWDSLSTNLDMKSWQSVLELGLQVAEGYLDLLQADKARAIYQAARERFSFVPNLEEAIGPRSEALAWVGQPLPALEGNDLAGKAIELKDYNGKVVLVDFWATWCRPCIASLPDLLETYEALHPAGFEIIGICLDENPTALESFLQRNRLPWRVMLDRKTGNLNALRFKVSSIPAAFLVDRNGRIARAGVPTRGFGPVVKRLLAQPTTSTRPG